MVARLSRSVSVDVITDGITPMVHESTVRATLTGRIPFPDNDSYLALIYMVSSA